MTSCQASEITSVICFPEKLTFKSITSELIVRRFCCLKLLQTKFIHYIFIHIMALC